MRWQRCQHRSQWSSPAVLFPLAQELIHSSLLSVPSNLLLVFSGSTFLPIKSSHCLALQGLVTLKSSGRGLCESFSFLILHLFFHSSRLDFVCLSFSRILFLYLLISSSSLVIVCVSVLFLLSQSTFLPNRLRLLHLFDRFMLCDQGSKYHPSDATLQKHSCLLRINQKVSFHFFCITVQTIILSGSCSFRVNKT